jgi:hypothetical protein
LDEDWVDDLFGSGTTLTDLPDPKWSDGSPTMVGLVPPLGRDAIGWSFDTRIAFGKSKLLVSRKRNRNLADLANAWRTSILNSLLDESKGDDIPLYERKTEQPALEHFGFGKAEALSKERVRKPSPPEPDPVEYRSGHPFVPETALARSFDIYNELIRGKRS